jgi:hypothetical protein
MMVMVPNLTGGMVMATGPTKVMVMVIVMATGPRSLSENADEELAIPFSFHGTIPNRPTIIIKMPYKQYVMV